MNKYDEMSSFDIAVELKNYVKGSFSVYADHKTPFVLCENTNEEFDPCNKPADMWPIIVDNNISITHYPSGDAMTFIQGGGFMKFKHESKNALRSAAITFLIMKDMTE